jgi:hypothetical protein
LGIVRKKSLDVPDDVKRHTLRGRRIVLLDIGAQRGQVGNRLR